MYAWLPTCTASIPDNVVSTHLPDITLYTGPELPSTLDTNRVWAAHNAWGFDELVWNARYPHPIDWIDTYPLACQVGLPGNIDAIGKALGLGGKEKTGKNVMSKYYDFSKTPKLMDLILITKYNIQDVKILEALYYEWLQCPRQPEWEMEVLQAHRVINSRGCAVDLDYLRTVRALCDYAVDDSLQQIDQLTEGKFTTLEDLRKRDKVIQWLMECGIDYEVTLGGSLAKDRIANWADSLWGETPDELTQLAVRFCQLRATALKITSSKLEAGIAASRNGRLQGLFAYWAAHTGRFGGRKIQVQNLMRPDERVDTWKLVDVITKDYKLDIPSIDVIRVEKTNKVNAERRERGETELPLVDYHTVAGSLLRPAFIGKPLLAMADFSAIECRELARLSGETKLLDMFRNNQCPYSAMAERIYGRYPANKKDPIRQVGKVVVLGAGYQLGKDKMAVYAKAQGIDLQKAGTTAEECIEAFRSTFTKIAGEIGGDIEGRPYRTGGYWHKLQWAVKEAVWNGEAELGQIRFKCDGKHLRIRLPSGRYLTYRNVSIDRVPSKWDTEKLSDAVTYESTHGYRKSLYGGLLCENIVQASCRDYTALAILRCEKDGIPVVLHIHDEVVVELPDEQSFDRFMIHMTTPPDWSPDFPLDAEGGILDRYNKTVRPGRTEVTYRNGRLK